MEIENLQQVDLLFALFLGRLPENNFVRHDNLGRPVLELVRAMISSDEFRQSVLERFLLHEKLPHRELSLRLLPDALALAAQARLAPPPQGFAAADWKSTLGRMLTDLPCRAILEEVHGVEGHRLIRRLNQTSSLEESDNAPSDAVPQTTADIVSGIEIVADTICRGWLIDRANPDTPLCVKVTANGAFAKILMANEFRRDVQDLYGGEGRCGFTMRIDLLPNVQYLSRVAIAITEPTTGAMVLPERLVELTPAPTLAVEAELREELAGVRECLQRVRSALPDDNQWKLPFTDMLRSLRAKRGETNLSLLRADLAQLLESMNRIEQDLPRLWTEHSWALSRYGAIRSTVELVLPAPEVESPATFSVVLLTDAADETGATLSSVLAQVFGPREIFLVASGDAVAPTPPLIAPFEVVHHGADQPQITIINDIGARATGSHLLVVDAGTRLAPEALGWFAAAIDKTMARVLYADSETATVDERGRTHLQPVFRPAFDYDLLLQRNYIGNTFCIDRTAFNSLDGFSDDPNLDAQYDFLLRAVEAWGPYRFIHVPQLLVSRHEVPPSARETPSARTLRTVQAHLDRTESGARAVPHIDPIGRAVPDAAKVSWHASSTQLISVIVPTRDRADMVLALVSSLRRRAADWDQVEVITVVNGQLTAQSQFAFQAMENIFPEIKIRFLEMEFNWGGINNIAVNEHSSGSSVVFVNDDMICLTDGWDQRIRSQLTRPELGVIGGRLLYPNGMLQHAGITFCDNGATAHEAMGDLPADGLYLDRTRLVHHVGAVTGAFLACRRELFDKLGGFDAERYSITSSDADFCVRARISGKGVIYDPFLTWIHYESASRGRDSQDYMKRWRAEDEHNLWLSKFNEIDLVDLSLNPQLAHYLRPFEIFRRLSHGDVDLWLVAQHAWFDRKCRA